MKVLLDMNVSPNWVPHFRHSGFECVHWSQIGKANAKDVEIFEWANLQKFIIFTHDLDFGTILANTNAQFPSVVQIRSNHILPDYPEKVAKVIAYFNTYSDILTNGALLTIDEQKHRIKILPLHRK